MDPLFHLAERRIAEAERAGAFADLRGMGKPLELDDLSGVPEWLRASYILLKTAGFVPPELEARREWLTLRDLLEACTDPDRRAELQRRSARAWQRYRLLTAGRAGSPAMLEYQEQMVAHLERVAR